jgi:hypothetical protein
VIADGASTTVPPHQHGGQVTLDWLTPTLRTTVEAGPLSDPFESARLAQAEGAIATLGRKLDDASGALNAVRLRVTQLAGNDATRESQVSSINVQLAGTGAIRDDNQALRSAFSAMQANIATAMSVGQKLTVDGSPVDMQAVSDRLKALESFRDGLKTAAGTPLDAAGIDAEIAAKTATLVSKTDLDAAFTQHPVTIPATQLSSLTDTISTAVKGDVNATMTQLAASIKAQTDTSLAGIDAQVARAVSDALPSLSDSIIAKVQPQIAAAVQGGVTQMQTQLTNQISATMTTLRAETAKSVADLQSQLGTTVRDQLQSQLQVSLAPIQKSLSDLKATVDAHTAIIAKHDATLTQLGQRVEASDATNKQALADAVKAVNARVDAVSTVVKPAPILPVKLP